jgi:hypothetical protein
MEKITHILENVVRCKYFEAGVHIKNPIKNSYQDGLGRTAQTLDHVVVVHSSIMCRCYGHRIGVTFIMCRCHPNVGLNKRCFTREHTRVRARGDHSLLYFAYTCVRDLFIGGGIYLAKKIIR